MKVPSPLLLVYFIACCSSLFLFHIIRTGLHAAQPGDLYLMPVLDSGAVGLLKPALILLGTVGLLFAIRASRPAANMWTLLTGVVCYLAFIGGSAASPEGVWCSALSPWFLLGVLSGMNGLTLLIPCMLLWAVADSSFVMLIIPAALMVVAVRNRHAFAVLALALTGWVLQLPYLRATADGFSGSAPLLLEVLGWQAPNFQAQPQIVGALLLVFVALYASRPVSSARTALAVAAFLMIIFQQRTSGFLAATAALAAADALERWQPVRLSDLLIEKFPAAVFTFLFIGLVEVWIFRGSVEPSPIAELSRSVAETPAVLTQLKLAEAVRRAGGDPFVEPDFQGRSVFHSSDDLPSSRFRDYEQIVLLRNGWEEIMQRRNFQRAFFLRAEPMASVLIERDGWTVATSSAPIFYDVRGLTKSTTAVLITNASRK